MTSNNLSRDVTLDTKTTTVDSNFDNGFKTSNNSSSNSSSTAMAGNLGASRLRGRIISCQDVQNLVTNMLDWNHQGTGQVDLTHLSLILGLVEHQFTANYSPLLMDQNENQLLMGDDLQADEPLPFEIPFPRGLHEQFRTLIRGSVDLSSISSSVSGSLAGNRPLIVEKVAEAIWSNLAPWDSRGHHSASTGVGGGSGTGQGHEQAHLQFISSFLLERKLDSFGVTCAVLAALQVLFPSSWDSDYFLTLSEDHSWISVRPDPDPKGNCSEPQQLVRVEVTWHGKEDMRQRNPKGRWSKAAITPVRDNWLYLRDNAVVCKTPAMAVAAAISALNPSVTPSQESLPLARLQRDLLYSLYKREALSKYPMGLASLADLLELLPSSKPLEPVHQLYRESVRSSRIYYDNSHIYPHTYLAGYEFRHLRFGEALSDWSRASRVIARYNYVARDDEEAYKEFQGIATELIPYSIKRLEQEGSESTGGLDAHHYRDLVQFYDGLCQWEQNSRFAVLHIGWAKSFLSCLTKFPAHVRSQLDIQLVDPAELLDDDDALSDQAELSPAPPTSATAADVGQDEATTTAPTGTVTEQQSKVADLSRLDDREMTSLAKSCSENLVNFDYILGRSGAEPFQQNKVAAEGPQAAQATTESGGGLLATAVSQEASSAAVPSSPTSVEQEESKPEQRKIRCRLVSEKMGALKDLLVSEKKLNNSAIQLQITAQSSLVSARRSTHHGQQRASESRGATSADPGSPGGGRAKRARTASTNASQVAG